MSKGDAAQKTTDGKETMAEIAPEVLTAMESC